MKRLLLILTIVCSLMGAHAQTRLHANAKRGFAVLGRPDAECLEMNKGEAAEMPLDAGEADFMLQMFITPRQPLAFSLVLGSDTIPVGTTTVTTIDDVEKTTLRVGTAAIPLRSNRQLVITMFRKGRQVDVTMTAAGKTAHGEITLSHDRIVGMEIIAHSRFAITRLDATIEDQCVPQRSEYTSLSEMQSEIARSGDRYCGIYRIVGLQADTKTLMPGGDYTLALVKDHDTDGYELLYVDGLQTGRWQTGMVKALLTPRLPGVWNVMWRDANGCPFETTVTAVFDASTHDLVISFVMLGAELTLRKGAVTE